MNLETSEFYIRQPHVQTFEAFEAFEAFVTELETRTGLRENFTARNYTLSASS